MATLVRIVSVLLMVGMLLLTAITYWLQHRVTLEDMAGVALILLIVGWPVLLFVLFVVGFGLLLRKWAR
jgi:hypothetical protein